MLELEIKRLARGERDVHGLGLSGRYLVGSGALPGDGESTWSHLIWVLHSEIHVKEFAERQNFIFYIDNCFCWVESLAHKNKKLRIGSWYGIEKLHLVRGDLELAFVTPKFWL